MPPTTTLDEPATRLRLSVVRLARRLRQHAGTGVTPSQLSALTSLEKHGPLSPGSLAARERIGKSSVTRLLAKLETRGYVERRPDPTDGRSSQVALTAEGQLLLSTAHHRSDEYLERQIAALTTDERRILLAAIPVLERLVAVKR